MVHPKFIFMVTIAIQELNEDNGSTIQTLIKYISLVFNVSHYTPRDLWTNTVIGLQKGIVKGLIEAVKDERGHTSSYKLTRLKDRLKAISMSKPQLIRGANLNYLDMIVNAIKALNESNGSLYYSIFGYISSHFRVDYNLYYMTYEVNKAFNYGIDTGVIKQMKIGGGRCRFKVTDKVTAEKSLSEEKCDYNSDHLMNKRENIRLLNQKSAESIESNAGLKSKQMNRKVMKPKIVVKTEPVIDTNINPIIKAEIEPQVEIMSEPEIKIKSEPIFYM